jgi:nitrite reductase/ring-hydroxylating ferredoxin subunit
MEDVFVAEESELEEGGRRIVEHNGVQVGVLRANGKLVAYRNVCPHQGGPVCDGLLIHKVEEVIDERRCYRGMRFDEKTLHIVCPWHGWEFDVSTGACAGDGKLKLVAYKVITKDRRVYVRL